MKSKIRTFLNSVRKPGLALVAMLLFSAQMPYAAVPVRAQATTAITIVPDQMSFTGDVATKTNSVGHCTQAWLSSLPAGSIILGVDPRSCNPTDWDGASASVGVSLPNVHPATVYVIELSWPDQTGKGLRSLLKNQIASILFDDQPVWSKRTTVLDSGYYYGAQHEPIKTTIVVKQSGTHTLTFTLPSGTAWDLSNIGLTAYAMPSTIQGIGYSPYRDCQYPGGSELPSTQNIQEDLTRLFHTSNAIRTYSSTGVNAQIPAMASSLGLPIFAGAWLDYPRATTAIDEAEIQGLISLAHTYSLDGVIVGNEYYLRHRTQADIDYLLQKIRQVKNSIPAGVPVTTAEIDDLMFKWTNGVPEIRDGDGENYRPILDEVDIVMVHIYPFWSGLPIDGAASYTIARYKAIQNLIEQEYPGQNKRVIIGEAGWPSAGAPLAVPGYPTQSAPTIRAVIGSPTDVPIIQAVPSLQNQRRYLLEFLSLAEQEGVEYFYFDAFDELWKIEEPGRVGQHWGYSYSDRSAKHSFYGILLPSEQLSSYNPLPLSPINLESQAPTTTSEFVDNGSLNQQFQHESLTNDITAPINRTFSVYTEWPEGPGHFVPSGWMGDISNIGLFGCDRSDPHSGEMAMRFSFTPTGLLGWAGVTWQYPENNWGSIDGGLDLSWANKLTFWAKGAQGGEKVKFFVGGIGTDSDRFPDSLRPSVSTGFVQLSSDWQRYTIDLRGKDLRHLVGGFGWVTDKCANPDGATFFLDDIVFKYDPNMPPPPSRGPSFPIYTDAAAQDNHFAPSTWLGDGAYSGRLAMTECWTNNPHSGQTSMKFSYTQEVIGWAGMFWVEPAANQGDRPGGIDLTSAKRISFWARTDSPGARVKFVIGGIGYNVDFAGNALCHQPNGAYPDSVCPKIEQTKTLNATWTHYVIDLSTNPRDLSGVVGGFGWVSEQPLTFYLDDIVYEFDGAPTDVTIGGNLVGSYRLVSGESARQRFASMNNGPVKVTSTVPIVASERVAYSSDGGTTWTSHGELMGLPANLVHTSYTFPLYNNVDLNSQLRFGNVGNVPTYVTVTIGGVNRGTYRLNRNEIKRVSYPGLNKGPVVIYSNGQPIIASLRVAYTPDAGATWTNFSEMMGLPSNKLTNSYTFPWYNNATLDSQIRFGNVGTTGTTVTVKIGGQVKGTYPLSPNQSQRVGYSGLDNGPVVIQSSGGVPIIASIRVAYTTDGGATWTDFSEMMGLPTNALSTSYSFPAYDNVHHNSQLRFGNLGTVTTNVKVFINGVLKGTYPTTPNASRRISYPGSDSGPVVIQSSRGVPIIASLRVAYTPDAGVTWTSFAEMMGLPQSQLTTSYYFPWYNNLDLDTQLRVGVP